MKVSAHGVSGQNWSINTRRRGLASAIQSHAKKGDKTMGNIKNGKDDAAECSCVIITKKRG